MVDYVLRFADLPFVLLVLLLVAGEHAIAVVDSDSATCYCTS